MEKEKRRSLRSPDREWSCSPFWVALLDMESEGRSCRDGFEVHAMIT